MSYIQVIFCLIDEQVIWTKYDTCTNLGAGLHYFLRAINKTEIERAINNTKIFLFIKYCICATFVFSQICFIKVNSFQYYIAIL